MRSGGSGGPAAAPQSTGAAGVRRRFERPCCAAAASRSWQHACLSRGLYAATLRSRCARGQSLHRLRTSAFGLPPSRTLLPVDEPELYSSPVAAAPAAFVLLLGGDHGIYSSSTLPMQCLFRQQFSSSSVPGFDTSESLPVCFQPINAVFWPNCVKKPQNPSLSWPRHPRAQPTRLSLRSSSSRLKAAYLVSLWQLDLERAVPPRSPLAAERRFEVVTPPLA